MLLHHILCPTHTSCFLVNNSIKPKCQFWDWSLGLDAISGGRFCWAWQATNRFSAHLEKEPAWPWEESKRKIAKGRWQVWKRGALDKRAWGNDSTPAVYRGAQSQGAEDKRKIQGSALQSRYGLCNFLKLLNLWIVFLGGRSEKHMSTGST